MGNAILITTSVSACPSVVPSLPLFLSAEILTTTEITLEKITQYQFLNSSEGKGWPIQQATFPSTTSSHGKEEEKTSSNKRLEPWNAGNSQLFADGGLSKLPLWKNKKLHTYTHTCKILIACKHTDPSRNSVFPSRSISGPNKSPSLQTLGLGHLSYNSIIIYKNKTKPKAKIKPQNPTKTHTHSVLLWLYTTLFLIFQW